MAGSKESGFGTRQAGGDSYVTMEPLRLTVEESISAEEMAMRRIIQEATGLEHIADAFIKEHIGPREALGLTDQNFRQLGVETIGFQLKIKRLCEEYLKEEPVKLREHGVRRRGQSWPTARQPNWAGAQGQGEDRPEQAEEVLYASRPMEEPISKLTRDPNYVCNHAIDGGTRRDDEILYEAQEIMRRFATRHGQEYLNILVVGLPGAGKSSLINSLLMSLNKDGYKPAAERGGLGEGGLQGRGHITTKLQAFRLFNYLEHAQENLRDPTFWDMPGLLDQYDEKYRTVLRLILEGRIREDYTIKKLLNQSTPKEIERRKAERVDPSREIHVAIYVHAATDASPSNLTTQFFHACNPNEQGKRDIPVICVITKLDQLCKRKECHRLDKIRKDMSGNLGLEGIQEAMFHTSLYCYEVTPGPGKLTRNHIIDKEMCNIWHQILLYTELPRGVVSKKPALLKRLSRKF